MRLYLIRLAALYIIFSGVYMMVGVVVISFYANSMIAERGAPNTLNGSVMGFNFPVSSVDSLIILQVTVAFLVTFGGAILFGLSKAIGSWIGRGLE